MNDLFLEKLVEINSDADIDRLKPGDVVRVKNRDPRVFEKREEDFLTFYYAAVLGKGIDELTTPRGYVQSIGNQLYFTPNILDKRKSYEPEDEDYQKKKDDLVALGLMKE